MKSHTATLPSLKALTALCVAVKRTICDEYRAFEDDEKPGIQLTVGMSLDGSWDYQTGDNSYSGGAYHHPYWGVVGVYRNSNCRELAREIQSEIRNAL